VTRAHRDRGGYQPHQPWPDDCATQSGGQGVVFGPTRDRDYTTAFFEAFPTAPRTFIRGEGATRTEAEDAAWAQWQRIRVCPGHKLERRDYRNGAGLCRHCDLFVSDAFEPIPDPDADGRLLERVFRGDPAAIGEVFDRAADAFVSPPRQPTDADELDQQRLKGHEQ
jgi:hypothetical protein